MKSGEVKYWNDQKGYGFIAGKDGNDYFVHYKNLLMKGYKLLNVGEKVSFDSEETDKGVRAINVVVEK